MTMPKVSSGKIAAHVVMVICQAPSSYGSGRYGYGVFGPRIPFCATGALWERVTPFSQSLF